ncbi:MAG: SDR family NAD(P)-dependent oxidoreductase [Anaerolineae bacterium]|nr:SDR family NAD(P)-dependent oxidoreductase [Anaerolineae bacterium]
MAEFSGKVAIITGASGLLASGVIPAFRAGDARLALTCGDDRLYQRFPDLREDRDHICLQNADLSDEAAAAGLVERTLEAFGRIDVLVNIVGGWDAGQLLHEMTTETWNTMLRLNATVAFMMSRAVIPAMLEVGSGAIVNIGAKPGLRSNGNDAAYSASKSAVLRLTESMSEEYKRRGIRVNAVLPSTIATEEQYAEDPQAGVTPAQLGRVIAFLASDAGAAIHGALIPVFGTR